MGAKALGRYPLEGSTRQRAVDPVVHHIAGAYAMRLRRPLAFMVALLVRIVGVPEDFALRVELAARLLRTSNRPHASLIL